MAYKEVTLDVDIDLDDFDTLEIIAELEHRAKKGDKEAVDLLRRTDCTFTNGVWVDVENALYRKDFEWIARWLWPQVKAQWPKHIYVDAKAAA